MNKLPTRVALALAGVMALQQSAAHASDWPQYRGPTGDGISKEDIKLPWSASGPKVLWKVPTPNGFGSFTIGGGEVFTTISREGKETCVALDSGTGKELWALDIEMGKYGGGGNSGTPDNKGGDGPRSTPVVNEGFVYVYSSAMVLYCLDAKTGKVAWHKDMIKDFGGSNISWANATSPVIEGDLVIVGCGAKGQSFVAFKKKTGEVAWKSGDEKMTHATPIVDTILGTRQLIFFMQSGLVSVSPDTGKELWRYKFDYRTSTAASPVACGDIVYCSAGYDVGAGACKITKTGSGFEAKEIWRIPGNKSIPNHWSTPVYKDGYLYGMFSFKRYGVGPLKCVEVATGKVAWEQPNFGAGNVILAHDKLIALADDGEVVIVDPNPTAYKEVARTQAVNGKCWSTPALADGHIFVRSTKEGACLDVSRK